MLGVEWRCVSGLVSGLSEPAQVAEGGGVSWVLAVAADGSGIVSLGGLYVLH